MTTMTASIPSSRVPHPSEMFGQLGRLLDNRRGMAQWWVDLTEQLDELATRLMTSGHEMWRGISDQITRDAPHMSATLRKLDQEQERIEAELLRVRLLAGECAGDRSQIGRVAVAVQDLMNRIRRHEEKSNQALYDAYECDLGGESA